MKRIFLFISVVVIVLSVLSSDVQAKSKNKKAYTAYSEVVLRDANDFYFPDILWYIDDVNSDGIKDLILVQESLRIYTYKKGKVSILIDNEIQNQLYYHKKDKVFWEIGEGSGGWVHKFKMTKTGKKDIVEYHAEMGPEITYYKVKNGNRSTISSAMYSKMWNESSKNCIKWKVSTFGLLSDKLAKMGK